VEDLGILAGLIAGVWAILLWLSIIVWVYRDIRERTREMMFFPGFNIPGLALYLMLRPRESLEESYARSLEEEALLREIGDEGMCPSCRRFVEKGWRLCPFCATQLKDICAKCEQLLSFNWVACPYCGTERRGYGIPEPVAASSAPTMSAPEQPPMDVPPRSQTQRRSQPRTSRRATATAETMGDDGSLLGESLD
jgi:RNA polymerase subunit RPABC4/transcription elongation factor Spt4